MSGRRQIHIQEVLCRNLKEDGKLKELGLDGRILLNVKDKGWKELDRVNIVEDRDKWRGFLNTVMNHWVA